MASAYQNVIHPPQSAHSAVSFLIKTVCMAHIGSTQPPHSLMSDDYTQCDMRENCLSSH